MLEILRGQLFLKTRDEIWTDFNNNLKPRQFTIKIWRRTI